MTCRCGRDDMKLEAVWDDAQETDHAFNVYLCDCGRICKEDVWNHKGEIWIDLDGTISRVRK